MTAQTKEIYRNRSDGDLQDYPVLASETIYQGSLVTIDSASGYAQANDGTTITLGAGDLFTGVAISSADNSTGANGDKNIEVYEKGVYDFDYASGGLTQANVGDIAYLNDTSGDGAVDASGGGVNLAVGRIVKVLSATKARVRIDGYAGLSIAV